MGKELFIEIGTEEIPAEFLTKTLRDMEELIRKELTGSRIPFGASGHWQPPGGLSCL